MDFHTYLSCRHTCPCLFLCIPTIKKGCLTEAAEVKHNAKKSLSVVRYISCFFHFCLQAVPTFSVVLMCLWHVGVLMALSNNESSIKRKNGWGRDRERGEKRIRRVIKSTLQEERSIIISSIPFKPCAFEQSDHRAPEETRAENRAEGRKHMMRGVETVGQKEVKM